MIYMLHSSDRQKNVIKKEEFNIFAELVRMFGDNFYAIDDLEKDGFIHADGSLRFEFKIKKNNNWI